MSPEKSSAEHEADGGEMKQEPQAPAPQVVVRRAKAPRTAVPAEMAQLNRICKSIALGALLVVVSVGLFSRFYAARFSYLPIMAMEQGDIARRLKKDKLFVTGIAPSLTLDKKAGTNLWHDPTYNPLYPALLGVFFRLRGSSDASVALFNGLVHLATALFVFLITRRLRGLRTAILATVLYSMSMEAIGAALSCTGITLSAFFVTVGVWAALRTNAAQVGMGRKPVGWAALTGALFACAYLSGQLTVLLFIPALLMVGYHEKRRKGHMALMLLVFLVLLLPWAARNLKVFGTLSPVANQYKLIAGTKTLPRMSVFTKSPDQIPAPIAFALTTPSEMIPKFLTGLTSFYRQIPAFLNLYLFPFLLLTGLWALPGSTVRRAWWALVGMVGLQIIVASLYDFNANSLQAFMPVGLCIATVTVIGLITTYLQKPAARWIVTAVLVAVVGFPYVSSMALGEKAEMPAIYRQIAPIRQFVARDALVATDIPAVMTWYIGIPTIRLPARVDGLQELVRQGNDPNYVYLSEAVLRGGPNDWVAYMAQGKDIKAIGTPIRLTESVPPIFERKPKLAPGVGVTTIEKPGQKAAGQAPKASR